MKYTLQQLEEKVEQLREKYKVALPNDKRLIEIRANLYKKQIEEIKSKKGFI